MRWPAAPQAILSALTLAILPIGKWLSPMGEQPFLCRRFLKGEIASKKFLWIRQIEQKNYQSGSTNHEKVKGTKQWKSRVAYVLCSS